MPSSQRGSGKGSHGKLRQSESRQTAEPHRGGCYGLLLQSETRVRLSCPGQQAQMALCPTEQVTTATKTASMHRDIACPEPGENNHVSKTGGNFLHFLSGRIVFIFHFYFTLNVILLLIVAVCLPLYISPMLQPHCFTRLLLQACLCASSAVLLPALSAERERISTSRPLLPTQPLYQASSSCILLSFTFLSSPPFHSLP